MDEVYFESHKELVAFIEKEKEYQQYLADAKEAEMQNNRQLQLQNKQEKERRKMAVIQALKERCINYGFTGNNNIAACVQREAQHDYEIEQKEYELKLAQAKLTL